MIKLFISISLSFLIALSAAADVAPAKSLRNGATYFIYDTHGDDGSATAHDKDTNYRYAFRYDAGDSGVSGLHVKAATAIAEGRTFNADYAWQAIEVNGKWRFLNVGTGAYITGSTYTGADAATMELEPTASISQFTLRMAGSTNNRWDGDYQRSGFFWNYQYSYPFVWWEGEGHPYEFYEAVADADGVYAFADLDRSDIDLIAQRALELKNIGLIPASAYSSAAIARANSNDEAMEAFNAMLAAITSGHIVIDGKIHTLSPGLRLFVEYDNRYLDGTHTFTATLKNVANGTLRILGRDIKIQMATPEAAAAEHLQGALALTADWFYSPEPGYVSISGETNDAWLAAEAAVGQNIAAQREAADALFAADPAMAVNLPVEGQSYAINYRYTFGLTYNNYLATEGRDVVTAREPQAWLLSEQNGEYTLSARGVTLSPLKIRPDATPDADGIYPFLIESDTWGLAFEFHIMKTNVVFDSTPMPVYLTNMEPDQSSISEVCSERSELIYFDLQGRRIPHPTRGLYITPTGLKIIK